MRILYVIFFVFSLNYLLNSCALDSKIEASPLEEKKTLDPELICEFGYILNDYMVVRDTIRSGESFGEILDRNHVWSPDILKIAKEVKGVIDVRRLRAGKPYTILARKDSTEKAEVFIYQHDKANYTVIDFQGNVITAYKNNKEIKVVEKVAVGEIKSSLSEAIDEIGVHPVISIELSDIYAWTIDFFHLYKGDKFKIIYEEKYIEDSIFVGVGDIKAAYFEHAGKPFYAFNFVADEKLGIEEYYDENANHLRRAFLKAPLKFGRISSRYNLKRKIAYYGKVKPHKGTDFAAPVGTPILSTANGRVTESARKGGNGKYVKIRHNATYDTQYLHMKKQNVKKGQYVKQGDVIGWVGMTGNTSGPHVCYRFWKNGKQVDPLKEKLPVAEPMKKSAQSNFLKFIEPIKKQLDEVAQ